MQAVLDLITALTAIAAGAANAALIFSRSRKAKLNGCEIMPESTTCRKISALFLETKGGPDLSCPFRNEHTKQCDVYSVRPLICKEYICSRLLQKPIAQTGLTKEKRDIHSLRWEVFKNPECENLLKEAQKAAMKRR